MPTVIAAKPTVSSKRHIVAAGALFVFLLLAVLALLRFDSSDIYIARILNLAVGRSPAFDITLNILQRDMFSTAVLITFACFVWFKHESLERRSMILVGMGTSLFCGALSRTMQYLVVTHPRPFHYTALNLKVPYGMEGVDLNRFSCFPSDHAAVAAAIVTTIFLVDRRVGILAACFAAVSNLARLFLGIHFMSDVVGGAALGILMVTAVSGLSRRPFALRTTGLSGNQHWRSFFYAVSLYICFCTGTLFSDARAAVLGLWHAVHSKHAPIVETLDQLPVPAASQHVDDERRE